MSAPARPRRIVHGGDIDSDWTAAPDAASAAALAGVHRPWLLDPTPVGDLEDWQAGYDPAAATALDDLLDKMLPIGPLGGTR